MQIRAIKRNGRKLTYKQLEALRNKLSKAIDKAAFVTGVYIVNSSRIDVCSGGQTYATVDPERRGYNYRVNICTVGSTIKGYKRTSVLTWDQRVELNGILNAVLDKEGISARIQSRGFLVRDKVYGTRTEINWAKPYSHNIDEVVDNENEASELVREYFPEHEAKRLRNEADNIRYNNKVGKVL